MSTIVVTARLIPRYGALSTPIINEPGPQQGGFYENQATPFEFEAPPTDGSYQPPPAVLIEPVTLIPADVQAAINRLSIAINRIDTLLKNVDAFRAVSTNDGRVLTIDQIYTNWLNLSFLITFNQTFRPGFGGEVRGSRDIGWQSRMDRNTLVGYDRNLNGLVFVTIHELGHTTQESVEYLQSQYDAFLGRGGIDSEWSFSPEFADTERYANDIVRDILNILGLPVMANPTHGY